MQTENSIFFFHDASMQLFDTSSVSKMGILTPEKIDHEMHYRKSPSTLYIRGLSQAGLEHFVQKYGSTYRTLYLNDCTRITDLSPLGELANLEALRIEWCWGIDQLWDMSCNHSLKIISIHNARQIIHNPALLSTSQSLEEIRLWGGDHYSLSSLECFLGMKSLKRIDLNMLSLENRSMDVLSTLPNLEEFHFDAGMLTTEEIAQICARYPNLYGQSLCAYSKYEPGIYDVRVCGYRKPGLNLPKDQKRLDRYVAAFEELVRKYRDSESDK